MDPAAAATPIRVAYVCTPALIAAADTLPANLGRASLVHSLLDAFGLLESDTGSDDGLGKEDNTARVVPSEPCTKEQLLKFHDAKFVDSLLGLEADGSDSDSSSSSSSSAVDAPSPRKRRKMEAFGLEDDCPLFPTLPEYVLEVAAASIQAARELRDGRADVAIAWTGGRHHARRGEASGFCYVQDIVLAILELRLPPQPRPPPPRPPPLSRILYLDLDLHHGDGVESAFYSTPSTLTLSLHLHSPLFFPSTGSLDSSGPPNSSSSFHALNLALHPGLSAPSLLRLFSSCIDPVFRAYQPQAVVVQCGADGLAGDPCKEWNLGIGAVGEVVKRVLGWKVKTLLLGGGGYNHPNTARCWAYLTSIALGRPLDLEAEIPPSMDEYAQFAPSFTLDAPARNMQDQNTEEKLAEVEKVFAGYVAGLGEKYGKVAGNLKDAA